MQRKLIGRARRFGDNTKKKSFEKKEDEINQKRG